MTRKAHRCMVSLLAVLDRMDEGHDDGQSEHCSEDPAEVAASGLLDLFPTLDPFLFEYTEDELLNYDFALL